MGMGRLANIMFQYAVVCALDPLPKHRPAPIGAYRSASGWATTLPVASANPAAAGNGAPYTHDRSAFQDTT